MRQINCDFILWDKTIGFQARVLTKSLRQKSGDFGILELQNRVTQNDVTLRLTNSKFFIKISLSSYQLDFIKY